MSIERRRGLMSVKPESGGLPSEYQQCEWIRNNSGSPYLKTVQVANNSWPLSIRCGFYATGFGVYNGFVVQVGTNTGSYNRAGIFAKNNVSFKMGTYNYYTESGAVTNKRVDAVLEYTTSGASLVADVAGTVYTKDTTDLPPTSWPDRYFYVFCMANNNKMIGRIYYVQVYQNGKALLDMIPCYRKSDGVIGMYDLVTRTFFTNAATSGEFSKGADVT